MNKMSNGKIERLAANAIEVEANQPNSFLIPNISKGDKGISFDGEIQVFRDERETVESLVGRVPVQVKGTQVEKISSRNHSFSLSMDHYRNYYEDGGVLFLVVEVTEHTEKQVFYKHLLSKELHTIIKNYGHQGSKSMELRPLSETTLYNACKKFIMEREKQSRRIIENHTIGEEEFTSYSVSSLTYDPNNEATSHIFEHDFTFYGEKEGIEVPLHHGRVHAVLKEYEETIIIDEKIYKFNVQAKEELSKTSLVIEESLLVEFLDNKNGMKVNVKMLRFNCLWVQLRIIPFLIELLCGEKVYFITTSVGLCREGNDSKDFIKALEQTNSMLLKLKKIFRSMGIDEKKEVGKEGDNYNQIINSLSKLVHSIFNKDLTNLNFKDPDFSGFINLSLGDIKLLLFYDSNGKGRLINAFSKDLLDMYKFGVINKNSTDIIDQSPYTALNKDFAEADNVNFDSIKKSFDRLDPFKNEGVFSRTNHFCLQCLSYYDTSGNEQVLDLVEYIYNKYYSNPNPNLNQNIILINKLQTCFRKFKNLSDEEYYELINLKNNSQEDIQTQFCASVLTQSKIEANLYFRKMDKDIQIMYKDFPIYTLYQKLMNQ
ncbi:DUF4365 domain-containing protein (plasmid) [Priestia megaterium]|uniref:DUF4365 domain-containing protein n=1 Tax=Priestia megaterium TaxID=1404 RepID=UPI001EDA6129|nr:DUF4365 domain-containing protein [Priestia megaterium]UKJ83706.1 DUF4365 domain-containing protein [Priestia megaterium]